MSKEFLFARHGESEANTQRIISNRPEHNMPLTNLGKYHANELLDRLIDRQVSYIYTSPLFRARETAEIIGEGLGVKVEIADALREPDRGEIEGRGDDEAWDMHDSLDSAWLDGHLDQKIPGGENIFEVQDRFIPFINQSITKHKDDTGNVLFLSHGSLLVNMLPMVMLNMQYDFARANRLGYAALVSTKVTDSGLLCFDWAGKEIKIYE